MQRLLVGLFYNTVLLQNVNTLVVSFMVLCVVSCVLCFCSVVQCRQVILLLVLWTETGRRYIVKPA